MLTATGEMQNVGNPLSKARSCRVSSFCEGKVIKPWQKRLLVELAKHAVGVQARESFSFERFASSASNLCLCGAFVENNSSKRMIGLTSIPISKLSEGLTSSVSSFL